MTSLGSRGDVIGLENLNLTATKLIKPIPTTEEWLLKFGFKTKIYEESKTVEYCLSLLSILLDKNKKIVSIYVGNQRILGLNYKYSVHQLQNLYFALTGEELTIKGIKTK